MIYVRIQFEEFEGGVRSTCPIVDQNIRLLRKFSHGWLLYDWDNPTSAYASLPQECSGILESSAVERIEYEEAVAWKITYDEKAKQKIEADSGNV